MTHPADSKVLQVPTLADLDIPPHAIVIADDRIPERFLRHFQNPILLRAGESLKSLSAIEALAEEVLSRRATRPLTLIAVGGGSLADAVAFLASVLWRGVDLWHVPSTLLAMVDSAHGGKTAVNLGNHKNQLGTFYAASHVVLVEDFLEDLPIPQREQGLAELLKGLWIGDSEGVDLWDAIGTETLASAPFSAIRGPFMDLLSRAISVKHTVVREDPFETLQKRTVLNFGHTLGHGLELTTGLSHGHAVAWGMACAAQLSFKRTALDRHDRDRLLAALYPLLAPVFGPLLPTDEELVLAISRDKKSVGGKLKGVFVQKPGSVFVADSTPEEWVSAFREIHYWWHSAKVRVARTNPHTHMDAVTIPRSKSVLNRHQIIADLHPHGLLIDAAPDSADTILLARGLRNIGKNTPIEVGDGGTTFRFLLARAAMTTDPSVFRLSPRLFARPHDSLIKALRQGGAFVELRPDAHEIYVTGWSEPPGQLRIEAHTSSQYASSLALLSASGMVFSLEIEGPITSSSYLDLTLSLLHEAGVAMIREDGDPLRIHFKGVSDCEQTLFTRQDESSAAVWRCLAALDSNIRSPKVEDPSQPDATLPEILAARRTELHIEHAPDLFPVVVTTACVRGDVITVYGGPTLRLKESDRITDLATQLIAAGASVTEVADGMVTAELPRRLDETEWNTCEDHRLAFAALLASLSGPLCLLGPQVVLKSYPRFWQDARALGWSVRPLTFPLEQESKQA